MYSFRHALLATILVLLAKGCSGPPSESPAGEASAGCREAGPGDEAPGKDAPRAKRSAHGWGHWLRVQDDNDDRDANDDGENDEDENERDGERSAPRPHSALAPAPYAPDEPERGVRS